MKRFLIIALVVIVAVLIFLGYSGLFTSIKVTEKEMGPYTLVYKDHKGSYKETMKIQGEITSSLLKDLKIETKRGFGIFYDDPEKVKEEDLRSEVGMILEEKEHSRKEEISKKYTVKMFPVQRAVVVEFPFKNTVSILLGLSKVYPKLEEHIKKKGYAENHIMELYNFPQKKILYIAPIKETRKETPEEKKENK
ncbi:MAG: GyrI-like domain-containing protein [bacterium]|nr:GyrI-like domain-containing protein [bacterium]